MAGGARDHARPGERSDRRAVAKAVGAIPEVRALHSTNGKWDMVAELHCGSLAELDQALAGRAGSVASPTPRPRSCWPASDGPTPRVEGDVESGWSGSITGRGSRRRSQRHAAATSSPPVASACDAHPRCADRARPSRAAARPTCCRMMNLRPHRSLPPRTSASPPPAHRRGISRAAS